MKITGFTIVRNAIKYDYPIVEAITSILPLCDEMIVSVGNSEDETLDLIQSIQSEKIKIIETIWDDSLREGGKVLAVETDKAMKAISDDTTWAFYIQADEVLHEKYYSTILDSMKKYENQKEVEGLLFRYKHFWGAYKYVGNSRNWYRREIRVIKFSRNICSFRDAQGFRTTDDKKLKVKLIDAEIYHYGWARLPEKMMTKVKEVSKFWHSDNEINKKFKEKEYDYSKIDSIELFDGTHPVVMKKRVENQNWEFEYDTSIKNLSFRNQILAFIEKLTGWRVGEYRNYKLL